MSRLTLRLLLSVFFLTLSSPIYAEVCANSGSGSAGYSLLWSSQSLGSGLGASGFSRSDANDNGVPEIIFGTGSGYGGNTSFAAAEYNINTGEYDILCQSKRYSAGISDITDFSNSSILHGTLLADGDGVIEVIDHTINARVQQITLGISVNDLAVGDVDNDGEPEIVALTNNDLRIYSAETYSFERSIDYTATSFTFGKFSQADNLEIALNSGYVLSISGEDVSVVWDYSNVGFSNQFVASGDIDNDGLDEIVGADSWYGLRTFNADDQGILWDHTADLDIDALQVFDTDGDGIPEVVYGDGQWGSLHILENEDGSFKSSISNPEHGVTDILVGDLDNDDSIEVLWGSGHSSSGPDYLFVHDLQSDTREWQSGDGSSGPYWSVAFGNINNDGITDSVNISATSQSGDGIATAIDGDTGEVIWTTSSNTFNGFTWTGIHDTVIADLDGDNVNEVLVATDRLYDGRIFILDASDGSLKNELSFEDGAPIYSIAVTDYDNDGDLEILAGSGKEHTGANGIYVYIIDAATLEWESTLPNLGNSWTDLWVIEPFDIDGDGTQEVIALHDETYIIDPDNNGLIATGTQYSAVAITTDVYTGDKIAYLTSSGSLYQLQSDGSGNKIDDICDGTVNALEPISAVSLAFTCEGRLGAYDVVGQQVSWITEDTDDSYFGLHDRLEVASVNGKTQILVGGQLVRLYSQTEVQVGDAPVAIDAEFSGHFRERIEGTLGAEYTGSAELSFGIYRQPQYGSVEITNPATGEFVYTPNGSYTGSLDFDYYISDGNSASNLATVAIELTNSLPEGESQQLEVHWNTLYFGELAGLDANNDVISFEIVSQPSTGVLTLLNESTGEYTYINNSSSVSATSFQYRIFDGGGYSANYTVSLNLFNTLPVAPDYDLTTYFSVDISTLLTGTDADGDTLSYELLDLPEIGTATMTASGLFTYEVHGDDYYTTTMQYRTFDGRDWSLPGSINVNVIGEFSPVYLNSVSADSYFGFGPLTVNFNVDASGGMGAYVYSWDFGDGTTSSEPQTSHIYEEEGVYLVNVRVEDAMDPSNFTLGYITIIVFADGTIISPDPDVSPAGRYVPFDFDGDKKADVVIRNAQSFTQFSMNSRNGSLSSIVFGQDSGDIPVSGDFDGDGIADVAVRRPSTQYWYIRNSSGTDLISQNEDGVSRIKFGGEPDDIPVLADFDGDGITDIAVRRPSTQYWYIRNSSGIDELTNNDDGITRIRFGNQEDDIPVVADYDGDGKADLAVRRPETQMWYIRNSTGNDGISGFEDGITRVRFGSHEADIPVPADFDGDGKADIAVRRPSNQYWYILNSSGSNYNSTRQDGIQRIQFGKHVDDIPIVADYDGDGIVDLAVRRPSNQYQYILGSKDSQIERIHFDSNANDIPVAAPILTRMLMVEK